MIFTLSQINSLWSTRTAVSDKMYVCEDGFVYQGLSDGTVKRIIVGSLDDYKAEIKKQELVVAEEEYNQQNTLIKITETLSKSTTKQVEVNFGTHGQFENEFTINDVDALISSKISASLAYEAPTGKDLDELQMDDLIIKAGSDRDKTFKLFITAADGSPLEGNFKINYKID